MSQAETRARKVLHLSGKDPQGVLPEFCALLSSEGAELVHLSQSSVHECLVVTAEVLCEGPQLSEKASAFAKDLGLHLEVTELPHPQETVPECGLWITALGTLSSGEALSQIASTVRKSGLRIARVDSISGEGLLGINLLASRKEPISRSDFATLRELLLKLAPALSVDLAVQRDDVYRTSKRLLCMDVDSTFVKGEFIDELADLCGVKAEVAAITDRAMRGELDFEASLRERVRLLKGLSTEKTRALCDHFELTPGADDLVRVVKSLGMKVGLVSGGFDFFVEFLRRRFGLDFAFANELGVEGGVLSGEVLGTVVDSHRKAQILKDMAHVFDIQLAQTVAAGDGANDIEMLKVAGLGIAFQAKPRLQEVADTSFNYSDRLDPLLYLMGFDARKLSAVCGQ